MYSQRICCNQSNFRKKGKISKILDPICTLIVDILKPPCKKHKQEAAISARNQDFGDKMKILKEAMHTDPE